MNKNYHEQIIIKFMIPYIFTSHLIYIFCDIRFIFMQYLTPDTHKCMGCNYEQQLWYYTSKPWTHTLSRYER